ncbi:hypothetical protein D6833_06295 [Candidatus Parcubacteria bacterium]|nr:MAG: hypothetical protein D6833_06295 [Candidatus Parcubacteria bacterium]
MKIGDRWLTIYKIKIPDVTFDKDGDVVSYQLDNVKTPKGFFVNPDKDGWIYVVSNSLETIVKLLPWAIEIKTIGRCVVYTDNAFELLDANEAG